MRHLKGLSDPINVCSITEAAAPQQASTQQPLNFTRLLRWAMFYEAVTVTFQTFEESKKNQVSEAV